MNEEVVREQARRAGIAVDWIDSNDQPQTVSARSLSRILEALALDRQVLEALVTGVVGEPIGLPDLPADCPAELELEDGTRRDLRLRTAQSLPPLEIGYHKLRFGERELVLAVAPSRCLTIADLAAGHRLWGLAAQIYSLRRPGDGGIGDTTAVAELASLAAKFGAHAVALSPMHSLFPADLSRFSPYGPSSRLFLNPLLIDPAAALGKERIDALQTSGDEAGALIDWPRAGAAKYALLRRLFDDFSAKEIANNSTLAAAFRAFQQGQGAALAEHARLEAEAAKGAMPVLYYAFLQWLADAALARTQAIARHAGMQIGLIADLAIGLDRNGTEVKSRPQDFLTDLSIGAPPDAFNARGQDWGLTTFSPHGLRASRFAPFLATLRAAMRHAGGVRIDHVMGLMRLWVLPQGVSPIEGAYLTYPFADMLRLLALESHRNRAIVIGEDLGTVPPGFRERLRIAGIAGMDVLWFQREGDCFLAPQHWRDDAVAMTTTHDLPTVAGWWQASDLHIRHALGRATDDDLARRPLERDNLWRTFVAAGIANNPAPAPEQTDRAVDAALADIAHSPSPLALVPLEDVAGVSEQPNLPGTIDEHPNWRRRFDRPADELLTSPAARRRLALLNGRNS
jgi:4-alpha-glucanotransferase